MTRLRRRISRTAIALALCGPLCVAAAGETEPARDGSPSRLPEAVVCPSAGKSPEDAWETVIASEALEEIRGLIRSGRYAPAEDAARQRLAAVEAACGPASLEAAEALDLLVQALWRGGRAGEAESLAFAERALAIKEKALGPEHAGVAQTLNHLGNLLRHRGDYGQARRHLERALAIRETIYGPVHDEVASNLNNLAAVIYDLGDKAGARRHFERVLAIREQVLSPDDPNLGRTMNNLAVLRMDAGEHAGAKDLYERALAIREKSLGPEHPDVAETALNLAILLRRMGDFPGARPLYERALAIREKTLGPDHPEVAKSLTHLAIVLTDVGHYDDARPLLERALAIREKSQGLDHPEIAETLNVLGNLLVAIGDKAGARSSLERALAIREKTLGPDHALLAQSLNNLAEISIELLDYEAARPLSERALAIREKVYGPAHPDMALGLDTHARVLLGLGDPAAARVLHERGIAIREGVLGPDHPELAPALVNLATVLSILGDSSGSRACFERALRIVEKAFGPRHPMAADCHLGLAVLHQRAGDRASAGIACRRALEIRERTMGPDHPETARALNELARIRWETGEPAAALEDSLRAASIVSDHLRGTARSLSERQALGYERVGTSGAQIMLSILASVDTASRPPGSEESVWTQIIRSRALVLDEVAARHRAVLGSDQPEIAHLAGALESARARLARLVVHGPEPGGAGDYLGRLQEVRSRKEQSERALAERSAAFRVVRERGRIGLSEVREALEPGSALVAFVQYDRLSTAGRTPEAAGSEVASYLAFVLGPSGKSPVVVPLGPSRDIDRLIRGWRDEVASSPEDLDGLARYRQAGASLRQAVWDPLVGHLGGARRVFVVPDGALNLVNLSTLPASGDRYLLETGPLIHYLSAERDLVRPPLVREARKGPLVLGGPDFDMAPTEAAVEGSSGGATAGKTGGPVVAAAYRGPRSTCGGFRSLRFDPLPSALAEADEVASLLARRGKRLGWSADTLKLTGPRAAEAAFKVNAAGRRILHMATHGFFVQDRCEPTPEGTSEGPDDRSTGPETASSPGENPLLQSGLALAGANRRDQAPAGDAGEDGILTAEEIASLDLRAAEWAVLSACGTGVGPVQTGEGVLGLRRAFEVAGARTLIMSLWSVEDHAAREWIRQLYAARLSGLSTAEAMRAAGLRMIRDRRRAGVAPHPSSWGAFVAAGDWR